MLRLSDIRCVIPDERPSLFDLRERYQLPPQELMIFHRIYGLDRVPVCRSPIDELLGAAVARLIEDSEVRPEQVKWLVYTHTGQQMTTVGQPLLNQTCRQLGLSHARAFGMTTNNCASTILALQVIERLLARARPDDRAILVSADIAFTRSMQMIPNSTVTGDAAAACLLGRQAAGHRLLASRLDIYGQHARCQWQPAHEVAEFERNYTARIIRTMTLTLEQAGVGWGDVRWVIPHNINLFAWKKVAKQAGIPLDRVYLRQLPNLAHCFGADLLINWHLAEQDLSFQPGDYVLLATDGLGAVFASALFQYAA